MPPLVIPNTIRVGAVWQVGSTDVAVSVFHARIGSGVVVDQALAATIALNFNAAALALLGNTPGQIIGAGWRMDRIQVRDIRTPNQPAIDEPVAVTTTGTGIPLPFSTAIVGTMRTALAGRSYRGRTYVPGWGQGAMTTSGNIIAAASARAQLYCNTLYTAMDADGLPLAVASPTLGISTIVTAISIRDDLWDTQRRRNHPGI